MNVERKTDARLKSDAARYEMLALWGGIGVIAGLVFEVVLAIEHRPSGETFLQTWGAVFADSLVAAGVFFEILFSRKALHQSDELQRRMDVVLAEANERAARLEREAAQARERVAQIERSTAWRRLTPEQFSALVNRLKSTKDLINRKGSVRLVSSTDPEAITYMNDLLYTLSLSEIYVHGPLTFEPSVTAVFGLYLGGPDVEEFTALADAFRAANIEFEIGLPQSMYGLTRHEALEITVGSKPPPTR